MPTPVAEIASITVDQAAIPAETQAFSGATGLAEPSADLDQLLERFQVYSVLEDTGTFSRIGGATIRVLPPDQDLSEDTADDLNNGIFPEGIDLASVNLRDLLQEALAAGLPSVQGIREMVAPAAVVPVAVEVPQVRETNDSMASGISVPATTERMIQGAFIHDFQLNAAVYSAYPDPNKITGEDLLEATKRRFLDLSRQFDPAVTVLEVFQHVETTEDLSGSPSASPAGL